MTRNPIRSLGTLALGAVLLLSGLTAQAAPTSDHPLSATFAAHGDLERFQQQRSMTYTMNGFPLSEAMARPNRSIVDLQTRRNRIDGDGFTVAFDGARAWSTPGPDAAGLPSRFVTLGSFYFIGMPFVFGDDGVVVTPQGTQTFRGTSYDVMRVSYRTGTGHTSKDDYMIFIEPTSRRLALIHHSVTENEAVERVTWTFDEWQTVNGLLVPARMTFYAGWNPDDPGEGASFTIEDVRITDRAPDAMLYQAPDHAATDDRPAIHD